MIFSATTENCYAHIVINKKVQKLWKNLTILITAIAMTACGGSSDATVPVPSPITVLFIGNSFTRGGGSPEVLNYKSSTVADLNGGKIGGVPAIFKAFTLQAGLNYAVSHETVDGSDLKFHYENKTQVIQKPWDVVLMQDFSTLDKDSPGNPVNLITYSGRLAALFKERNPSAIIKLSATWSRADQTYTPLGHWYGQPIERMAIDIMTAYQSADQQSIAITGVVPIGLTWNQAFTSGFADPNPYKPIDTNRVNLWASDNYHASKYGYYLEALTIFGSVTGKDPRILGANETVASELSITPAQAQRMQQIAYEKLN